MNSIRISTKTQILFFPILLETVTIAPAVIKLLTRTCVSYLPFQIQIVNYEDKSTDIPMTSFMSVGVGYYCVWKTRGHCTHLRALQLYRSAGILRYCLVFFSFCKKYVRLKRVVSFSGRLAHCPRLPLPLHTRSPFVHSTAIILTHSLP